MSANEIRRTPLDELSPHKKHKRIYDDLRSQGYVRYIDGVESDEVLLGSGKQKMFNLSGCLQQMKKDLFWQGIDLQISKGKRFLKRIYS